ncbi:hypothetical protein FCOIX_7465 [Fusarium coicis]|nr:hypothetical protein FCOIX_7465 [Fusarium coicis]
MEPLQLRELTRRPSGVSPSDQYEYPEDGLETTGENSSQNPEDVTQALADKFLPITEEEAHQTAHLPKLDYRPRALKNWSLICLMIWHLLCIGALAVLVYLGQTQPPWFRFKSDSSLWLYMPGLVSVVTNILWTSLVQWYNRIIPYFRMANMPITGSVDEVHKHRLTESLNNVPLGGFDIYHIRLLLSTRDPLTAWVSLSTLSGLALLQLKAGLFQLEKDTEGWRIRVSTFFGFIGIGTYLFLLLITVWIFLHFRKRSTGLKWDPTPLATQVGLLQGSNIFNSLEVLDFSRRRTFGHGANEWPGSLVLRLGYWKHEKSNLIIHGVRFVPQNDTLGSEDNSLHQAQRQQPMVKDSSLWDEQFKPDVDRVWIVTIADWWLIMTTSLGIMALVSATFALASGRVFHPFKPYAIGDAFLDTLCRFVVFGFLPSFLFELFTISFRAADTYNRTMMPVHNMTTPLSDEEQKRMFGSAQKTIKGATATESMLLDYISPNVTSIILQAFNRGHYKIILGSLLSTFRSSVFLITPRLFYYKEAGPHEFEVQVDPTTFYILFVTLLLFCISNWILRPRGPVRTCRPLWNIIDVASLIRKSHILQCPEFWSTDWSNRQEHQQAQVTLADRIYRFGIYQGTDQLSHVGISLRNVSESWMSENNSIECLELSMTLMKSGLTYGAYDSVSSSAVDELIRNGPSTNVAITRVRTNPYRRWRKRFKTRVVSVQRV